MKSLINNESMKRVIVTGSSGFVGKYLLAELIEQRYIIYIVARKNTNLDCIPENSNCHIILSDLEELDLSVFPEEEYYAFIHMGWGGVNREDIDNEIIHRKNYENSKRCLKVAKELKCRMFVDTGSRAEYGILEGTCSEDKEGIPFNSYGRYKKKFYEYACAYCRNNALPYIHFRFFSLIGVGDHPWSLVMTACRKFKNNERMELGACNQLWNFLSVKDAVKAMILLMENEKKLPVDDNRIVNIASEKTYSLKTYIMEIYSIVSSTSEIVFDDNKKGYDSNPSIMKLKRYTNWTENVTFENQIREILCSIE